MLHNDLATALDRTGQYAEAEEHVLHSLEIASSVVDQDVLEHLATFHYNLGMILVHQGSTSNTLVGALVNKGTKKYLIPRLLISNCTYILAE